MKNIFLGRVLGLVALFFCALSVAHAQNENADWLARSVSLRELGFTQATTFNQKLRERHFYFPIAQGVSLKDAYIDLDAVYLRQFASLDGLTILINGTPVNAQSLAQNSLPTFLKMIGVDGRPWSANSDPVNEEIHLSIPLKNLDPTAKFVDVGVSFNSLSDAEHCTDVAGRGNELQLDARSRLRYRYDRRSVTSVSAFLTTLPRRTQILIPNHPDAAQYEAALRLLMGLRELGLDAQVTRLPVVGDELASEGLNMPPEWSGVPLFASLSAAIAQQQKFHLTNDQDVAAWLALKLMSNAGLADVVIDSATLRGALIKANESWQSVSPSLPAVVQQAVAWAKQPANKSANLALTTWSGAQLLAIDAPNQSPAALLTGSFWSAIANGSALGVNKIGALKVDAVSHRLMIAQNLSVQYLQGSARWEIPYAAKDLPNGERPNSVQLNVLAAHKTGDTPTVVSVFMNDYLITAKDLRMDGEVTAISAFVPLYTLKANNVMRIEVFDTAQKNCSSSQSLPLQILPSSYLGLGGANDVKEFFSLVPQLTHDSAVIIPPAYLQHAEDSLITVSRVLQGLAISEDNFHIEFPTSPEFSAKGGFVSFEVMPKNMISLVETQLDKLVVKDKSKTVVFDSAGLGSLAVVQIVEGQGVLVSRVGKDALNLQTPLEFSSGNLAILDKQGVKLTLNTSDPQEEFSLNESGRGISYFIERYHFPFVIAIAVLCLALMLMLTRLALKEYHTRMHRRKSDQ